MTQRITYHDLSEILIDIHKMMMQPALAIFLGPKVREFNKRNDFHIQKMRDNWNRLIDQHVEKDEKGQPKVIAMKDKSEFVYLSQQDEDDYKQRYNDFMNKTFDAIL